MENRSISSQSHGNKNPVTDGTQSVNLNDLSEPEINALLMKLEATLKDMEENETQHNSRDSEIVDDDEEQTLRDIALKSTNEKATEDLIEFTLNEIERESVERQSSSGVNRFPVTTKEDEGNIKFPAISSNADASMEIDINNNPTSKISKDSTVNLEQKQFLNISKSSKKIKANTIRNTGSKRIKGGDDFTSLSDMSISDDEQRKLRRKLPRIPEVSVFFSAFHLH